MGKPILSVDFDGVLHSYTSGWLGADKIPDPPVPGSMEFLREAVHLFDVQIFSSRSHQLGGIGAMRDWLRLHGPDLVEFVTFPTHKPPAHISLDDRGWQFNGVFPKPEELLAFKPWNKRNI